MDEEEDESPPWATQPPDRLHDEEETDISNECDSFIRILDAYRATGEWTFCDPEYVERVRAKLAEVMTILVKVQKSLNQAKAA